MEKISLKKNIELIQKIIYNIIFKILHFLYQSKIFLKNDFDFIYQNICQDFKSLPTIFHLYKYKFFYVFFIFSYCLIYLFTTYSNLKNKEIIKSQLDISNQINDILSNIN